MVPQMGPKSSLFDIFGVYPDLPVPRTEIEFAEVLCPAEMVQTFVDSWEWVLGLFGDSIEFPVVCAKTPGTIGLFSQCDRSTVLAKTIPGKSILIKVL